MKVDTLRNKLASIYKDFLRIKDRHISNEDSLAIQFLKTNISNSTSAIENKNTSAELANYFKSSIENDRKALELAEKKKEKTYVSNKDYDIAISNAVSEYQKSVATFTKNGGTGIYDLAVNVYAVDPEKSYNHLGDIGIIVKSMQDKGFDIQVFHKEDRLLTLVMPSSILDDLKSALNKENDRYITNGFNDRAHLTSFSSYFILPTVTSEINDINQAKALLSDFDPKSSWYVHNCFTSMGYFRSELSEQGFSFNSWDHLKDSITESISCMDGYTSPEFHVNGLMPSPYVLSSDEKSKLNITSDKEISYNVVHDLQLQELAKQELGMSR